MCRFTANICKPCRRVYNYDKVYCLSVIDFCRLVYDGNDLNRFIRSNWQATRVLCEGFQMSQPPKEGYCVAHVDAALRYMTVHGIPLENTAALPGSWDPDIYARLLTRRSMTRSRSMSSDTIPPLPNPWEDELDSIYPPSPDEPLSPVLGTMQLFSRVLDEIPSLLDPEEGELDASPVQLPRLPQSVDEEASQSDDGSFHTHDEGDMEDASESLGSDEEDYESAEEGALSPVEAAEEGSVVYASAATQTSERLQQDIRRPNSPRPRPRPSPENDPRPVEFRRLHGATPAIDLA